MSLNQFSELFLNLDSSNSINKKLEILKNYFSTNNDLENSWSIYLLTGKKNKRFISGRLLKKIFSDIYGFPLSMRIYAEAKVLRKYLHQLLLSRKLFPQFPLLKRHYLSLVLLVLHNLY